MSDRVLSIVEQLSQRNPFYEKEDLPDPPRPCEAAIPRDRPSAEQIPFIQQQISILGYNHLPRTFFSLEKHRSLQSILFTAKEVLYEALPIRCLEATFVALYYTQMLRDIDRIPLSFKSEANKKFYRHIVLVIRTRVAPTLYGALGLSRKSTLMYKPLTYSSLFDLVMDYKREYKALGHELLDIKLGIAISHDEHSRWDPCWRFIAIKMDNYRDGAHERSRTPLSADQHKANAHITPKTSARKGTTRVANAPSSSNGGHTVLLPLLSLGASHAESFACSINGDASLERSVRTPGDTQSEAPVNIDTAQPSLLHTTGLLSTPATSASTAVSSPPQLSNTGITVAETYTPLEHLLGNYMRLLPIISDQYYKGIASADNSNRAIKLCFMDLDTAERDASAENQRRLQLISEMQSPLSAEAKRLAAGRQLKPPRKNRSSVKSANSGGSGSAKHPQSGSNSLVKRGRLNKSTSTASPPPVGASDSNRALLSVSSQHNRSPRMPHPSVVPDLAQPFRSLTVPPSAEPKSTASLSAALASINTTSHTCIPMHGIVVDAQNTSGSGSPPSVVDYVTEGSMSPCNVTTRPHSEASFFAPPLTPRNCDARRPFSSYESSLRSASSAHSLFSTPSSLNATAMCSPHRSP
ncbi:hypothetical protein JKF63_03210 [Porcisia hertigi]|uniref:Uncharacterized protein n=1 Tax=Porcisia hertigi TaxID=2761500 RepID=A0A836L944_9TRYP|nr:hypothetical protein JKF63_03210 [Porcisia hertigi]